MSGRLGNQMFKYAFGVCLNQQTAIPVYYILHKKGLNKTVIFKYFKTGRYNYLSNAFRKNIYSIFYKRNEIRYKNAFDFHNIHIDNVKSSVIAGLFQSEKYFENCKESVKREFVVKDRFVKQFKEKYHNIFSNNKIIAMHFRKGDYECHGNYALLGNTDISLPVSYYHKALNMIEQLERYKVMVISDEIEKVRKHFSGFRNISFEKNDEIVDFQIIKHSDIAILSNSTFAWWAAYLNEKPDKYIIAPKYWMGFHKKKEYPAGIMSVNWKWMEV